MCRLPVLKNLKERLAKKGGDKLSAVFMTGSGSTIVCVGSDEPQDWLFQKKYRVRARSAL